MSAIEYEVVLQWDEKRWRLAEPIYEQAFPAHGRKSREIIRRMFDRNLCQLHLIASGTETAGMALTGIDSKENALIIDYIAVKETVRGQGIGRELLNRIKHWAKTEAGCKGIVIEAEAGPGEENNRRIRFWEANGFRLASYVHQYIWVPEPYRAMVHHFDDSNRLPEDGERLFRIITRFHQKAYRRT